MKKFGGMISFDMKGGLEAAKTLVEVSCMIADFLQQQQHMNRWLLALICLYNRCVAVTQPSRCILKLKVT
jgi:hypothetical protein